MKDTLRRILDLVRKTGDTMVVTDQEGEDVFVVMGLEQYEFLIDETPRQFNTATASKSAEPEIWDTMKSAGEEGETWDLAQMSEEELSELEEQYRQFAKRNVETAIEEPSEKPKKKNDFGEEQFYLEPVE